MVSKQIITICSSNSTNNPAWGALAQIMMLLHSNHSTLWVKAWVRPLVPSLQIQSSAVLSSSHKWEHKSSLSSCWSRKIEGHWNSNVHYCHQLNEHRTKGEKYSFTFFKKNWTMLLSVSKPPLEVLIEITLVNRPSFILCCTHTKRGVLSGFSVYSSFELRKIVIIFFHSHFSLRVIKLWGSEETLPSACILLFSWSSSAVLRMAVDVDPQAN